MTNDELDLVPIEDIASALERRYDGMLLAVVRDNNDGVMADRVYFYKNWAAAIGLGEWATTRLVGLGEPSP